MAILSKRNLNEIRDMAEQKKPYNWLNESVNAKHRMKKYGEVTVFLSHKHDENVELENAIALLNSLSVLVYVDWLDDGMPKRTSGETAIKIKRKIRETDRFIFLATEKAISSKWCNWELGLGDADKYIEQIALLTVKETYQEYTGSEYLQIYPYIYETDSNKGTYYIKYPDGKIENLVNWLKK